jgi:predicted small lipoprotein YifL
VSSYNLLITEFKNLNQIQRSNNMLKKFMVIAALFATVIGCAQAGGVPPAVAPVPAGVAAAQENPHKTRDALIRGCKHAADQQQLVGNERNVSIATCVKNPPK